MKSQHSQDAWVLFSGVSGWVWTGGKCCGGWCRICMDIVYEGCKKNRQEVGKGESEGLRGEAGHTYGGGISMRERLTLTTRSLRALDRDLLDVFTEGGGTSRENV